MKNTHSYAQAFVGRMLLLLLLLSLPAVRAAADDLLDADKGFYVVNLSGSSTIAFSVPCYNDVDEDSWVYDGYLNVTWTDDDGNSHSKSVIHWQRKKDCDDISTGCFIGFSSDVPGTVKIGDATIHTWNQDIELYPFSKNFVKAEGSWKLPYELLGHKMKSRTLKFSWNVKKKLTSWSWTSDITGFDTKNIEVPPGPDKITPQLTMATLTLDSVNTIECPGSWPAKA